MGITFAALKITKNSLEVLNIYDNNSDAQRAARVEAKTAHDTVEACLSTTYGYAIEAGGHKLNVDNTV